MQEASNDSSTAEQMHGDALQQLSAAQEAAARAMAEAADLRRQNESLAQQVCLASRLSASVRRTRAWSATLPNVRVMRPFTACACGGYVLLCPKGNVQS